MITSFSNAVAVVPSDATFISGTAALWIGGSGNLVVEMSGGNPRTQITLLAVPAGMLLPLSVDRVMGATTATNIVAFR
jgi:hypothetical protein